MYKTQIYSGYKAECILAKVAKKQRNHINLWLYNNYRLLAHVVAQPFDYIDGLKNVSFVGNVIIERCPTGFRIYIV